LTLCLPDAARRFLEPALEPGTVWDEIEQRFAGDTVQLWLRPDCAMLTELYPGNIHVWLAGGALKSLLDLRPQVEATARFWGCTTATINGRLGWDRVLRNHGYQRRGDELEKVL
jgi:hypothetical protein